MGIPVHIQSAQENLVCYYNYNCPLGWLSIVWVLFLTTMQSICKLNLSFKMSHDFSIQKGIMSDYLNRD